MNDVFVVCNQLGQYWGKKKRWVDGTEAKRVLTCRYEDEAINLLVELSARDTELRGEVRAAALNERGVPDIEPSKHLIEHEPDPPAEPEGATPAEGEATGEEKAGGELT